MSATSKTFQVTVTATGTTYDISAINLVLVEASGTGSKVTYNVVDNAVPQVIVVDESPATISTASQYLISVTDATTSTAFYLNPDRITDVISNGSAAYILYDKGYNEDFKFSVTQSRSTIRTAIAAIVSSGSSSVTTGITAFAGGGQASATALSYGYNEITTVATALDSVKLPAAVVGAQVTVLNDGANIANIYPATAGTINDGGANSPIPIAMGVTLVFTAITSTNWETTSQVVAVPDGTAGAPSLTFEADADNGMYYIGPNNYAFAANGAKVLDISTAGLGITGIATVSSTTASSSKDTGAFICEGGVGIEKEVFAGLSVNAGTSQSFTTVSLGGDGAVGAPAYSFTSSPTQGMYTISATQLGFAVGGVLTGGFNATGVFTNAISEQTGAAGVTVDGALIKDGGISANSMFAAFYPTGAQDTRADAGAVSITSYLTLVTTTGPAAITLADGAQIGQMKKIRMTVDGGDATLTLTGYTSIVFNDVDDLVILMWNGSAWKVLENYDTVITP